jgi:hypothetical protein
MLNRRSIRIALTPLLLIGMITVAVLAPAYAGPWQGTEVTEDGWLHVKNPAEPMQEPMTVELEELWRIGGDTDDPDEFFGVIAEVLTDPDGNVYLLDAQLSEVKVYSADGEFLRVMGREGEGPGEFRRPSDAAFLPDGNLAVVQTAPGRIVMLTPEGEPAGDLPVPDFGDAGSIFLRNAGSTHGGHLVVAFMKNHFDTGKLDQSNFLSCISTDGEELARLHEETRVWDFANPVIAEKVWDTFDRRWLVGPDGRIFACTSHADYEIRIWQKDGTPDRVVTREYDRLGRTAEEIEWVHGIYEAFTRQAPNSTVEVEDTWKDVNAIYSRNDGSLWVLTSRGFKENPEGSIGTFDVFDNLGHFVTQITLNGEGDPENDGYYFVGDRLYVVTDFLQAAMAAQGGGTDETVAGEDVEPMAVICYQLRVPDLGSSE